MRTDSAGGLSEFWYFIEYVGGYNTRQDDTDEEIIDQEVEDDDDVLGIFPQVFPLLLVCQGPLNYQDPRYLSDSEQKHWCHRLHQSQDISSELSNLNFYSSGILFEDRS